MSEAATTPSTPGKPRRGLFWRVYLYGLLMLLTVAVGMALAAFAFDSKFPSHRVSQGLSRLLAADLHRSAGDPRQLQQRLDELRTLLDADVGVYKKDGTLVAAAAGATPAPLSAKHLGRLNKKMWFHHRGKGVTAAIPMPDGNYLLLQWPAHNVVLRLVATIAMILGLLAIASFPLVRAITRPLDQITDAARRLGQGDLTARTELKRKDELGTLAGVLDEMAARLEHTLRAEKELWANISHEMRTPLARIRVALELCEEEEDVEAVGARLSGIGEDLGELDSLINDVLMAARLDLARGGDGGFALRREPTSIATLVQEAGDRFTRYHPSVDLEQKVEPDLPPVDADQSLMHRVFGNLLDNAAKYSDPEQPVTVEARRAAGDVVVEVMDRGVGVTDEELSHLFDHFFRADRSRSRGTGGVGLGLTLCKRIIEAHGGKIWAARREGGGLCVGFSLVGTDS